MVRTAIYFALVGISRGASGRCLPISPPERSRPKWQWPSPPPWASASQSHTSPPNPPPLPLGVGGVAFAVAGGPFSGIGSISYYVALQRGNTAVATTVTALYFVVAAVFGAVFLGESVDMRDVAGIGLAAGAVVLLAT